MTAITAWSAERKSLLPAGILDSSVRRGRVVSTFRYNEEYLAEGPALEPALVLHGGPQPVDGAIPRSFQDSAPDRWGRNLIVKRVRAEALREKRSIPTLDDRDFLMGVSDETRQGSLRFTFGHGSEFQHPGHGVPKLVELPRLMRAADDAARDDPTEGAIKELLDAGTGSLGGARPKASVRDGERLMIAKFGHASDGWDVMRWEKTALDIARSAGVAASEARLVELGGRAVLLVDRFDRAYPDGDVERVGYISALTLLEADDGTASDYLDIADALSQVSVSASADLEELWRRAALSVALHNTDDHLRNHGLLRVKAGWTLAPAFDMNPEPGDGVRRTGIAGAERPEEEAAALIEYSSIFGLSEVRARAIVGEVVEAASMWRSVARSNGVVEGELTLFEPALDRGIDALVDAAR